MNAPETIALPDTQEGFASLYRYLSLLEKQREYEKSRDLLDLLIDFIRGLDAQGRAQFPELWRGYHLSAENRLRRGEVSAAARIYREGLQTFPHCAELRIGYGECLTRLRRFADAEGQLQEIDADRIPMDGESPQGLLACRRHAALGELYQNWGRREAAERSYAAALALNPAWVPAHVGLVETAILRGDTHGAEEYLAAVIGRLGRDPALLLALANIVLITGGTDRAEEILTSIEGALLGDDRFEYLLFQIDFFSGDRQTLIQLPTMLRGETVETEAARIWLDSLKGTAHEADPLRIPAEIWREEYQTLENVWKNLTAGGGTP